MQEILLELKKQWSQFNLREKQIAAGIFSAMLLLLVYLLIWSPFLSHLDQLRAELKKQQTLLAQMQAAEKIFATKNRQDPQAKILPLPMLLGWLQKKIEHDHLNHSLTQLKQTAGDSIEMHFQNVSFDQLIQFLIASMAEQSFTIKQFSVSATTSPGLVNIDALLES